MNKIHKEELIEYLNEKYSTLDIDEARHFVNKHFNDERKGFVHRIAHEIATKEHLMETTPDE